MRTGAAAARAWWRSADVTHRLRALVAVTVVAALLVAAAHSAWLSGRPVPSTSLLVLLVVLFPLGEIALLHIRFGSHQVSFTWGETAVVIGFTVMEPGWSVLIAGPTCALVHLAARRGPLKAAYNGAGYSLSVAAAGAVLWALGGSSDPARDAGQAAVLLAAALTYSACSVLLSSTAVAIAQGLPLRTVLADSIRMYAVTTAGNIAVAACFLVLAARSPATLFALPPLVVGVYALYRAYLSASSERDVWQQLEAAARELNHLDEDQAAAAVVSRATQLFRCDRVELVVDAVHGRAGRVHGLNASGAMTCGIPSAADLDPGGRVDVVEIGGSGSPSRVWTSVIAVLEGPAGRVGALRLGFLGRVELTRRERQVLSTFAHAVSTTVLNAVLHEEVRAEALRHAHEASHDSLTGLANRILLGERTAEALRSGDGTTALLLLDLDHFKQINDTLGHGAGDLLLQELSQRLTRGVRQGDLVARLGGDEFAVLLTGLSSPDDATPVAAELLRRLAEPVEFDGLRLSVEGSLGIACHPQDADTADELFRRADVAMYQAKSARGSWLRYSAVRDDSSVHRLALVAELRTALEQDQIVVHFQPQVDLRTGLVVGAEALARWQHPVRGLLAPSAFVGVAEQSGLVRPFTLHVLDKAVAECADWQRTGRPVQVAVNLAARSLLDRQLPEDVAAVLAEHGLPADRLVLEITETTAASELEVVEDVLSELRHLGVEISVDDFGTGYSSLAFLQRTAVNELKIDRSFVLGLLSSDNDRALVGATVGLAHSLGARVVAEGVEDAALAMALREMGCDLAQGFWFSPPVPVPVAELRPLLPGPGVAVVPTARRDADADQLRALRVG